MPRTDPVYIYIYTGLSEVRVLAAVKSWVDGFPALTMVALKTALTFFIYFSLFIINGRSYVKCSRSIQLIISNINNIGQGY